MKNKEQELVTVINVAPFLLILIGRYLQTTYSVRKWICRNETRRNSWSINASHECVLKSIDRGRSYPCRIVDLVENFYACDLIVGTNRILLKAKVLCPSTSASPPASPARCSLGATRDLLSVRGPCNGRILFTKVKRNRVLPEIVRHWIRMERDNRLRAQQKRSVSSMV